MNLLHQRMKTICKRWLYCCLFLLCTGCADKSQPDNPENKKSVAEIKQVSQREARAGDLINSAGKISGQAI